MKIENAITKEQMDKVVLWLSRNEAAELRDSLDALLKNQNIARHEHVASGDFEREVTVIISEDR